MARHQEPLTRGLVTIKDPALLEPGQLSDLKNGVYQPGTEALHRARGRSLFGSMSATSFNVVGLRDIHFDNGDHYLIAGNQGTYFKATADDAGVWSSLDSGQGAFTQLEVAHYRNRFYLMNGLAANVGLTATTPNSQRVFYLSATAVSSLVQTRQHGMLPVIAAPAVDTTGGSFSQTVTGYYEYWTTEVAKFQQDNAEVVLESAFTADTNPTTVFVSATSVVPIIYMPTLRNAITTHWRIYRSPKKDKESDKKFPSGFMISEVGTATASQKDTLTTATATSFPSSFNSGGFYFDWANASRMSADDGNYASGTVPGIPSPQQQGCYGFNLGGFNGSVKGIEVEVQGYISGGTGPVPVAATIGKRRSDGNFVGVVEVLGHQIIIPGKTATKSAVITATAAGSPQTIVMGSSSDRWFPSDKPGLVDTDFGANFMIVLTVSKPSISLGVDYLKARVHYAATVDSVVPFPTVVYTFGDISAQVAKNHPPPSASTGDLFEDTLVLNDVTNPGIIRYSYPGDPEAFPPTYFIDFETRDNDQVRLVRVVNNRLVVGLDTSLWRANYLPSERDASFDRGKAIEPISRQYGCVDPMCGAVFTRDGGREELAFISHKGLFSTDGFDLTLRSGNLDWRRVIQLGIQQSEPIALINDPEQQELLFYYRNDFNGNETYLCLHFSYGKGDTDADGNFKVSGPVHMRNFDSAGGGTFASLESAWAVPRANGDTSIYLGYGSAAQSTAAGAGGVYRETGSTIPAQNPLMTYTTREMYLADKGGEFRLDQVYALMGSYSLAPALTYTFKTVRTNDTAGLTTQQAVSRTASGEKLVRLPCRQGAEGLRITMSSSGQLDQEHQALLLEGQGFGLEDGVP